MPTSRTSPASKRKKRAERTQRHARNAAFKLLPPERQKEILKKEQAGQLEALVNLMKSKSSTKPRCAFTVVKGAVPCGGRLEKVGKPGIAFGGSAKMVQMMRCRDCGRTQVPD